MKYFLFSIFLLTVTLSCIIDNGSMSAENGRLSGVATFSDSYEAKKQADAGCEFFAVNETDLSSTPYADITGVIEQFRRDKSMFTYSVNDIIDPGKIRKAQNNFDTISKFTSKYITGFKQLPAVVRASTNGKGAYSLSLKPGKYFILVISGNVKSANMAESKGNVGYKVINIKPVGETFLNVNFVKQEPYWFMSMFNLSGC